MAFPVEIVGAVVVAAGKGLRAGQALPKQFAVWRGKPVLRHAVDALRDAGVGPIVAVIPENGEEPARAALDGLSDIHFVEGGETRQESVCRGIEAMAAAPPDIVLIHDAARPDCPRSVVDALVEAASRHGAAIPVLPVVDSVIRASGDVMLQPERREELWRVQTPQAFAYELILAAHRSWQGEPGAGDDAQVASAAGAGVRLVEGSERLGKLTFAEDFREETTMHPRTGIGYDVHRLAVGEELWLCGVRLEHEKGLAGHSDADVGLHAVVDAILGAAGEGDIGQHFPPSDPQWRGAASARFVEHAVSLASAKGFAIGNVDLAIICEAPKIGPHRDAMRARLADLLGVGVEAVNVKATTTEKLGFTGRGEGIAAQAVATLYPLKGN